MRLAALLPSIAGVCETPLLLLRFFFLSSFLKSKIYNLKSTIYAKGKIFIIHYSFKALAAQIP